MFPMKKKFPNWLKVFVGVLLIFNLIAIASSLMMVLNPSRIDAMLEIMKKSGTSIPSFDKATYLQASYVTLINSVIAVVAFILIFMNKSLGYYIYAFLLIVSIVLSFVQGEIRPGLINLGFLGLMTYGVMGTDKGQEGMESSTQSNFLPEKNDAVDPFPEEDKVLIENVPPNVAEESNLDRGEKIKSSKMSIDRVDEIEPNKAIEE